MQALLTKVRPLVFVLFFCTSFNYGDEFAFDPPKNFTLSPEYIALHHPVKTKNVAAQLYFDQGLTFLFMDKH